MLMDEIPYLIAPQSIVTLLGAGLILLHAV